MAAVATAALLALPAFAAAHGNGNDNDGGSDSNWKKGKWGAKADLRPRPPRTPSARRS